MKPENYVKNFRDVGESLFRIYGDELFPKGVLYRGGRLNSVFNHNEIFNVPTILNLRIGSDDKLFNCNYLHVPAEDKIENYDTSNGKIRKWVNKVISTICQDDIELPIFIHCTSGKDRTGVITAAILKSFGISNELIVKEYLLSDGVEGARPIKRALEGFGSINHYLKGDLCTKLTRKLIDSK